MKYEWVTGRYTGEQAKNILGLSNSNMGYIILENLGRGNNAEVVAAFTRAVDQPTPNHLVLVGDPYKINQYEKTRCIRKGVHGIGKTDEKCAICGIK